MLDDANIRRAMRIVEDAASLIEKDARFGDGLTPHEIILITSLHILGGCCGTCRSYLAEKIQAGWIPRRRVRQKPSNALRGCTELANRHPADYRFLQTRAWRDHIRPHQLAKHPVCAACAAQGRVSLAQEVDHIVPPNGNQALMRDPSNFQSLCKPCHSRKTRAQARGYSIAIGVDGYPIDPSHPSIEFDRRYGPWGAKTDEAD